MNPLFGARSTWLLVIVSIGSALAACSSGSGAHSGVVAQGGASGSGVSGSSGSGTASGFSAGNAGGLLVTDSDAAAPGGSQTLTALRITPANATITVAAGQVQTQAFRALGTFEGNPTEQDITDRTVFYVPDRYLVGGFPADGGATFSTRLPSLPSDPPQQGGVVTVQASAANGDASVVSATTSLTVQLVGSVSAATAPLASPPIPDNPQTLFAGTPDAAFSPSLVYPNDGVMLPPNLRQLEIHWLPVTGATLYEVAFESATADIRYYTRCAAAAADFDPGSCALLLDDQTYGYVSASNSGLGPVALSVRATDEQGKLGASQQFSLEFAENSVDGAVYYWNATATSIMRFDFGSLQTAPEQYLAPGDIPNNYACVGCHALSRDGTKMLASLDNSFNAKLLFVGDVKAKTLTYNGALAANAPNNRILIGSFAPDGSSFVANAPPGDTTVANADHKLFFHDGTTGVRSSNVELPFAVANPNWSPDGKSIAMTAIANNFTSNQMHGGSIAVMNSDGAGGWAAPITVVPSAAGKNRYTASFLPDSASLLYNESVDDGSATGDSYADPSAKVWAVQAQAGASPVWLANADKPGVNDGQSTLLMDTFARPTPFETVHRGGKLFWFTFSSQRRAGLRSRFTHASAVGDPPTQELLWMVALDPAKVQEGQDGSYPAFFLPFQDMHTSNHMAQWTEKLVSATPPPPAPTPPPPSTPPTPSPPK
jgi:hypothetical protein